MNHEYVKTALSNFSHKEQVVLLTFGGSHAYGTNIQSSDIDLRGVCINTQKEYFTMNTSQNPFVSNETDTTIYFLKNFISLAAACNPNIIELLGCKKEHYFILTPVGQMLLDNKKLFLSKLAINSFGGYATQQLRRLQNALAHDHYPQKEKEEHIIKSLQSSYSHLETHYTSFCGDDFRLSVCDTDREGFETEIFLDASLKHYPLREYAAIMSEMNNTIRNYDKLNQRNKKKDDVHLNKHAMHLLRLKYMLIDILKDGDVETYRDNEHNFLMGVRNGSVTFEEVFKMNDKLEIKAQELAKTTKLPDKPNQEKIENLLYKAAFESL